MHLIDVQEGLSTDFTGMGAQQDILACLLLHLVGKSDGFVKIKVFEESLSELSKTVGVGVISSKDEGQRDRLKSICLQKRELDARFASLGSWLIVRASKKESCDHMANQMLGSKFNHIEVTVSKVLSIGEKRGKHSIGVCSREREDKRPVQKPGCLVQHTHGTLSESLSDHLLDLANSGELS